MTIKTKHCRHCARTYTECTAHDTRCPSDGHELFDGGFPESVRYTVGRYANGSGVQRGTVIGTRKGSDGTPRVTIRCADGREISRRPTSLLYDRAE